MSSEGGLLALREMERRLGLAERLAACLKDPRMPEKVVRRSVEIIRFRMLKIAGYEDGDDANTLRSDPMFKLVLALWRRFVFAIDDLTPGKPARYPGVAAPRAGAGRTVLRLVPDGAKAHRARYRRHP